MYGCQASQLPRKRCPDGHRLYRCHVALDQGRSDLGQLDLLQPGRQLSEESLLSGQQRLATTCSVRDGGSSWTSAFDLFVCFCD
jgi:hypothetical protein